MEEWRKVEVEVCMTQWTKQDQIQQEAVAMKGRETLPDVMGKELPRGANWKEGSHTDLH